MSEERDAEGETSMAVDLAKVCPNHLLMVGFV